MEENQIESNNETASSAPESTGYSTISEATNAAVESLNKPQQSQSDQQSAAPAAPQIQDISKLQKFLVDGKEYTYEQLKKERMLQSDYTKKTQEIASFKKEHEESKKYWSNLSADLKNVKANPALAEEFKKVYPEQYHGYLDFLGEQIAQPKLDPFVEQKLSRYEEQLSKYEEKLANYEEMYADHTERSVHNAELEIDAAFKELGEKYPQFEEVQCLDHLEKLLDQRRQEAIENGQKPSSVKLEKQDFEQAIKASHEYHSKRYQEFYNKQFNNQKATSTKLKGIGAGGGTPSGKPVQAKTIAEATRMAIEDSQTH